MIDIIKESNNKVLHEVEQVNGSMYRFKGRSYINFGDKIADFTIHDSFTFSFYINIGLSSNEHFCHDIVKRYNVTKMIEHLVYGFTISDIARRIRICVHSGKRRRKNR